MRDVVWLIADLECRATLLGFLERPNFHLPMGCAPFCVDPNLDFLRDEKGKDPGVWKNAGQLLRSKCGTHKHALVILDQAFEGSPGATQIESDIVSDMTSQFGGWRRDQIEAIVIQPELEAWIWQDNPHVEAAFGYAGRPPTLRNKLAATAWDVRRQRTLPSDAANNPPLWPAGRPKPPDPKAAVEATCYLCHSDPPSAVFNEITSNIGIGRCVDPAFLRLRDTLRRWFPPHARAGGAV